MVLRGGKVCGGGGAFLHPARSVTPSAPSIPPWRCSARSFSPPAAGRAPPDAYSRCRGRPARPRCRQSPHPVRRPGAGHEPGSG